MRDNGLLQRRPVPNVQISLHLANVHSVARTPGEIVRKDGETVRLVGKMTSND